MANGDAARPTRAVLVSLRPRFAMAIATGSKTVELRRRFPDVPAGTRLVIYATLPVGAVVGVATIQRVERAAPDDLWAKHGGCTAVTRAEFDAYFAGVGFGLAVSLSGYTPLLTPLPLSAMRGCGIRPPQSFTYLPPPRLTALLGPA